MERSAIAVFTNRSANVSARSAAAIVVGRLLADEWPLGPAWGAACTVLADESDSVAVRCAAVRTLASAPAAAPNQLVRGWFDPARDVRREAIAVLRSITVPAHLEARLVEQLSSAEGSDPVLPLLNLALSFGYDPRIVRVYERAVVSDDAEVRAAALRGLAMIGEMGPAVAAVNDPAPKVRVEAAAALGGWSTLEPVELEAARALAKDADPAVRTMGRKALRLLGVRATPKPKRAVRGPQPVDPFGWTALLERISFRWLGDRDYAAGLDDAVIESGWLGRPPATESEIASLETRVGQPLPPSYAAFLRVSNGFGRVSPFIDGVLAASDVRRFADEHSDWIAAYAEHDKALAQVLSSAWQVSGVGDGVLLLHPGLANAREEWEASLFADWVPGRNSHESFLALVTRYAEP